MNVKWFPYLFLICFLILNSGCIRIPGLISGDGGYCRSGMGCTTGNCVNRICCAPGQRCCLDDSGCLPNFFCTDGFYCLEKKVETPATSEKPVDKPQNDTTQPQEIEPETDTSQTPTEDEPEQEEIEIVTGELSNNGLTTLSTDVGPFIINEAAILADQTRKEIVFHARVDIAHESPLELLRVHICNAVDDKRCEPLATLKGFDLDPVTGVNIPLYSGDSILLHGVLNTDAYEEFARWDELSSENTIIRVKFDYISQDVTDAFTSKPLQIIAIGGDDVEPIIQDASQLLSKQNTRTKERKEDFIRMQIVQDKRTGPFRISKSGIMTSTAMDYVLQFLVVENLKSDEIKIESVLVCDASYNSDCVPDTQLQKGPDGTVYGTFEPIESGREKLIMGLIQTSADPHFNQWNNAAGQRKQIRMHINYEIGGKQEKTIPLSIDIPLFSDTDANIVAKQLEHLFGEDGQVLVPNTQQVQQQI